MKNIILALFLLCFTQVTFSQTEWCATDEMLENYFQSNPEKRAEFFNQQSNLLNHLPTKGMQSAKAPTIIIPVVVHVIHYNGAGNVSKLQIEDGIRVLNEDFQKLNADTTQTRAIFKGVAADVQMEFRLAKIDPDGNCTEGINRINSYLTYNNRNEVKALSYWDANKYLNVWLVNTIRGSGNGTTLGYAQFPNSGNLATYGLVCRNDEWGDFGTSQGSGGRTATHEVGHCFGLFHTFQSSCGSFCTSSGDFVCDTPPAANQTFGCNYSNNTCANDVNGGTSVNPNPYNTNVPDQLENYMSYDDCQTLFTEGQKDRMQAAFSVYSHLNNLRSASNLVATGTNNGYNGPTCAPRAYIIDTQKKLVCIGNSLTFSEDSYDGAITTYDWEFPGATPSTSNSATPTVTYTSPGVHDVILRVSNASGADTLVISDYVVADDTATAINPFNYVEGFENATTVGIDWISLSPSGNAEFIRTTSASFAGNASLFLNNYGDNSENEIDIVVTPSYDFTQVISPRVKFKIAFAHRTGSTDQLKLAYSTDCGENWSNVFAAGLRSFPVTFGTLDNSSYAPTSTIDWKDLTIPLNSTVRNGDNIIFKFEFKGGNGNNLYIDDFQFTGQSVVGVKDVEAAKEVLNLYPNPTNGITTLEFKLDNAATNGKVYMTDILGKKVIEIYTGSLNTSSYNFKIDTDQLNPGIYFLSLDTEKGRKTKKLVVR